MTDQPPSHPDFDTVMSAPHWGELLSLYNVYRDYMKHEDDLINQRASWHLLLQGFLFATFGVMGEWQTEGGTGFLHPRRYWILYGLIATGFFISLLSAASILAANAAINKLHKDWEKLRGNLDIPQRLWTLLPGLAGAGSESAKLWGKLPAIGIPMIIAVAWLWVLACAVYSQTHPVAVGAAMGASQPSLHTDISKPVAPVSTRTP